MDIGVVIMSEHIRTIFHAAGKLLFGKTLPVTYHIPFKIGYEIFFGRKLVLAAVLHFAEQFLQRVVNGGTKFRGFIFRGGNPDQVFEIKFQRALQVIIKCRYIHHKFFEVAVNIFFFNFFDLRRGRFGKTQSRKLTDHGFIYDYFLNG